MNINLIDYFDDEQLAKNTDKVLKLFIKISHWQVFNDTAFSLENENKRRGKWSIGFNR